MLDSSSVYPRLPPQVAGHARATYAARRSFYAHTLDFEATRYAKDRRTNTERRSLSRAVQGSCGARKGSDQATTVKLLEVKAACRP